MGGVQNAVSIVSCSSQADGESCLERASLLIEIHLRDLSTQKALLTRNEMVAQRVCDACI